MSSREDKDMVQEKLDSSQARYIEIQEKSNSRSELLQQAYSNAQIFGEDEVELMNWLNEIHDKLSKLSVQDCNTELLEKQHSELLVFWFLFIYYLIHLKILFVFPYFIYFFINIFCLKWLYAYSRQKLYHLLCLC